LLGVCISLSSTIVILSIRQPQEHQGRDETINQSTPITLWLLSIILCGVGWNLTFTGATVWMNQLYNTDKNTNENITQKQQVPDTPSSAEDGVELCQQRNDQLQQLTFGSENDNNKDVSQLMQRMPMMKREFILTVNQAKQTISQLLMTHLSIIMIQLYVLSKSIKQLCPS
jgi:hypothetical protein